MISLTPVHYTNPDRDQGTFAGPTGIIPFKLSHCIYIADLRNTLSQAQVMKVVCLKVRRSILSLTEASG